MSKRPYGNSNGSGDAPPNKRPRDHYEPCSRRDDRDRGRHGRGQDRGGRRNDNDRRWESRGPPPKSEAEPSRPILLPSPLPPLPPLKPEYANIPFVHKSTATKSDEDTYDLFELMGDADIERMASEHLIRKYKQLKAGEVSQLRELLVKNETLAEFSKAYGLDKKIKAHDMATMQRDSHGKGNKGLTKVIADVFEAYVCAFVKSASVNVDDPDDFTGYIAARNWLITLWTPRIEWAIKENKVFSSRRQDGPLAERYDDNAKATLQKRIMRSATVRLNYVDGPNKELKGNKLGQNEHTQDLYLDAPEYEIKNKFLATGRGRSKAEAGNWCAVQAMHGRHKDFIDDLEQRVQRAVTEHKKKKQEEAAARIERAIKTETEIKEEIEVKKDVKEEVEVKKEIED